MMQESYELWAQLEKEAGVKLYRWAVREREAIKQNKTKASPERTDFSHSRREQQLDLHEPRACDFSITSGVSASPTDTRRWVQTQLFHLTKPLVFTRRGRRNKCFYKYDSSRRLQVTIRHLITHLHLHYNEVNFQNKTLISSYSSFFMMVILLYSVLLRIPWLKSKLKKLHLKDCQTFDTFQILLEFRC